MNRKHGLFALFFALTWFCLTAVYACYVDYPRKPGWVGFWLLAAVACIGAMLWVWFRADKVADVLAQAGLQILEREGLCFAIRPAVMAGRSQMTVIYQNRYDTPCSAEILLRPGGKSAQAGLKRLRLQIQCAGAGTGTASVPWSAPVGFWEREITYLVGADVAYPNERGQMVRFRDGMPVGSLADVESDLVSWVERVEFRIVLPEGFVMPPPAAAAAPSAIVQPDQPPGNGGTAASPHAAQHPGTPSAQPGSMPPVRAEIGERQLTAILLALDADTGLRRQEKFVAGWKRDQVWQAFAMAAVTAPVAALLSYFGFCSSYLKLNLVAVVLGLIAFFAASAAVSHLRSLLGRLDALPRWSISGVCRRYYSAAFSEFKSNEAEFIEVCQHFAEPVLKDYPPGSKRVADLLRAWRALRERIVAEDAGFAVSDVVVDEIPRPGGRAVDVVVRLYGDRGEKATFRNVALCADERWFLATPEPLIVEDA